jgi:hypothetical protein
MLYFVGRIHQQEWLRLACENVPGKNKEEAFLKAMLSTGQTVPTAGGKILVSIQSQMRASFMSTLKKLSGELYTRTRPSLQDTP